MKTDSHSLKIAGIPICINFGNYRFIQIIIILSKDWARDIPDQYPYNCMEITIWVAEWVIQIIFKHEQWRVGEDRIEVDSSYFVDGSESTFESGPLNRMFVRNALHCLPNKTYYYCYRLAVQKCGHVVPWMVGQSIGPDWSKINYWKQPPPVLYCTQTIFRAI